MIFRINVNDCNPGLFHIGRVAENEVTQIDFDLTSYIEEYGEGGGAVLTVQRFGDSDPYLIPMIITDGIASWYISDADTAVSGRGACQLTYTVGDKVKKTAIYPFSCGESLEPTGEAPDPFDSWLETLAEYTSETSANAAAARTSASEAASSAQSAQESAQSAKAYATASAQSAAASAGSASEAAASATAAQTSAETAEEYMESAQASAQAAAASVTQAGTYAGSASQSAAAASTSAGNAQTSAEAASESATRAEQAAERAEEVSLEIPTKVSQLENDAGYVTEEALLAAFPTDTASGAVASFPDGAALPLIFLDVNIDPVQDLHGYSNPWTAGGGKNLFNVDAPFSNPSDTTSANTTKRIFTPGTYCIGLAYSNYFNANSVLSFSRSGNTLSVSSKSGYGVGFAIAVTAGQQYFVSCTAQSPEGINHYIQVVQYAEDGTFLGIYANNRINSTFTALENAVIAVLLFRNNATDDNHAVSTFTDIQVEKGSSATAYAPYSNICPISGWTGAKVVKTGKNLWNKSLINGTVLIDGLAVGKKYTVTAKMIDPSKATYFYIQRAPKGSDTKTTVGYVIASTTLYERTFTVAEGYDYYAYSNSTYTNVKEIQIEEGSAATDYVAPQTTPITIPFGQTVYGGVLDVLSGVLTITKFGEDLSTKTWQTRYTGTAKKALSAALAYSYPRAKITEMIAENYSITRGVTGVSALANPDDFAVSVYPYDNQSNPSPTTIYAVVDVADSTPSGLLVYDLATPIEIQLDPHEVSSLLGQNNIFADTGDSEVEYRADPTLFVNKKIAEAISALS